MTLIGGRGDHDGIADASKRGAHCRVPLPSNPQLVGVAHSPFTMSNSPNGRCHYRSPHAPSRSRDAIAPGVCNFSHPMRGGRSADRRPVLARHRGLQNAAGRGTCEAPRRPLRSGRRASRRSFPGDFGPRVRRFRPRHFLRSACSQLLAARVVVPGERFPKPSGAAVTSRGRRTPRPAPSQARLRRRPSLSRTNTISSHIATKRK